MDDIVLPFQLDRTSIRGRVVRLGPTLDGILKRHAYPLPVGRLLGEALSLTLALGSSLKYDGVFTLQIKSEKAVRQLVADITTSGDVRAYAQFNEGLLQDGRFGALVGEGYLAFTVDQSGSAERYQGIVNLEGDGLAESVQHYFRQSEQIPTTLMACARQDADGYWRGGGLMLQKMPAEGETKSVMDTSQEDDWLRAMTLMQTCGVEELTDPDLSATDILYRLFHEFGVRVFDARHVRDKCRCSFERVRAMLEGLSHENISAFAVDGKNVVTCEFCGRRYEIPLGEGER